MRAERYNFFLFVRMFFSSSKQIRSRKTFDWSTVSLSLVFLFAIGMFLFASDALAEVTCEHGYEPRAGVCFPTDTGLSNAKVEAILVNLAQWMFSIIGVVAVGMIAVCGAKYLLAGGHDETIKGAKKCITWAIVGIIVALSGLVIIFAVNGILLATPNAI